MTPGAGVLALGRGHKSHIVKMHYYFKNLLPTPWHKSDRIGVLMLGRGLISHFSEYVLSSTVSIYSTLIATMLRDYDAAF